MSKRGFRLSAKLKDFLMPELCAVCGKPIGLDHEDGGAVCVECGRKWADEKRRAEGGFGDVPAYPFDQKSSMEVIYAANYEPVNDDLAAGEMIYKLKGRATKRLVEFVTDEYLSLIKRGLPELFDGRVPKEDVMITYVPRRPEAVCEFGYDHMDLCARRLSELCGIRFGRFLIRGKNSDEQKLLTADERERNIRESLRYEDYNGSRPTRIVLLIDDIVTTGASMRVATELLKANGAEEVLCVSLLLSR